MKFKVHYGHKRYSPPPSGRDWLCRSCGEICRITWQDVGPHLGQESYYEWRSECCGAYYDERDGEE